MLKLAVDLHIHSCLSPCGDSEMTPNNLSNMAFVKGLDAIAVCDHNATGNLPACKAVADARGLIFIPGMEVETREEVHVLTLFPMLDIAMDFGAYIYRHLPDRENIPQLFGNQIAMNECDAVLYEEKRMLLQAVPLSLDEVVNSCQSAGGVAIPAHINRTSNSLLSNLGFIPPMLSLPTLEVYNKLPISGVALEKYHIIYSSDAHILEDILEREHFVSAYEKSAQGILAYLAEMKKE